MWKKNALTKMVTVPITGMATPVVGVAHNKIKRRTNVAIPDPKA